MKTLTLTIVLVLTSFLGFSQDDKGQNITVTIENVQNDKGKVIFALHTKSTFMQGPGVDNLETSIKDGKVSVTFKNVKPGEYAILALHDENENKQMDFQANGMPKEAYGTTNNPMFYGPPQYNEAKFTVADKDLTFKIRF